MAEKKRVKQKCDKSRKCIIKMILRFSKQIFSNKVLKMNRIVLTNSQNMEPSPRSRRKELKKILEMRGN